MDDDQKSFVRLIWNKDLEGEKKFDVQISPESSIAADDSVLSGRLIRGTYVDCLTPWLDTVATIPSPEAAGKPPPEESMP